MQVQDWVRSWAEPEHPGGDTGLPGGNTGLPGGDTEVQAARSRLEEAVGPLGDRLLAAGAPVPLRLSNSTIADIDRCDGLAVARAGDSVREQTWPMLRGRALDAYVQHVLFTGMVGDPVEDLLSMWVAEELEETVEAFNAHLSAAADRDGVPGQDGVEALRSDLGGLASGAASLSPLREFVPRTEQRLEASIAGIVVLAGRVDVMLGGAGTGLAPVLLEVKSAALRPEHMTQVRHYALLQSLREGQLPVAAGVWSPGVGVTDVPLINTLASSAERIVAAAVRTTELWEGEAVRLNPGGHCRFCPEVDRCPEGSVGSDSAVFDEWGDW